MISAIKPIEDSLISIYIYSAEKEGLVFNKSTKLYGLFIDEELIAFTGIQFYKNKAVFKNHYVMPIYRGKGYFKQLFNYSLVVVKSKGINIIEATCTNMSIRHYLKNGFKVIKKYKNYTKVKNENISV